LCKAQRLRYANNDMAELERCLKDAGDVRFRLIATDGVFSMDGVIADLPAICDLAERYDAMVMVDDSHALGFVGEKGRGTPEYCGVEGRIDIVTGTLGKALGGASGGFTAARGPVVDWLRQRSRPYLFSNTLAPVIAATSLKVFVAGRRRIASAAFRQRQAIPRRHDEARFHAGARRPSDHPGNARRCGTGAANVGPPAGRGHLCRRIFLPRRPQGQGAHPHADVGGPQQRRH
jgi:glycine C-acetyltransferase